MVKVLIQQDLMINQAFIILTVCVKATFETSLLISKQNLNKNPGKSDLSASSSSVLSLTVEYDIS